MLPTASLSPTQGTFVCVLAIVSVPFYSLALAQTSSPHPLAQPCTWEVCSEKAPALALSFSPGSLSLSVLCLEPGFSGDPLKTEVLARRQCSSPLLAWEGAVAELQSSQEGSFCLWMVGSFPSPPFPSLSFPSLFTHTVNKCLLWSISCHIFHIFVLFWGVITLFKMALKCSAEVLSGVPKCKEALCGKYTC